MVPGTGHGLLLAYSRALQSGPRVRLRLARARDYASIRALFERTGHEVGELELARLTRFDPRTQLVVCATTLLEGRETLVGVGAIRSGPASAAEPELLLTDEELCEGLEELLREALIERVRTGSRARVA